MSKKEVPANFGLQALFDDSASRLEATNGSVLKQLFEAVQDLHFVLVWLPS